MATSIKISQLPAKDANLEATDLLEVSEFNGTGYVSKSITGQEIIDAVAGGGVTDVTASAPLASSGGSTPDISLPQADAGSDGYLSSADYITFNNKQEPLVSGTNIKTINGSSVLGSGDLVISGSSGFQFKAISTTIGTSISGILGAGLSSSVFIPSGTLSATDTIMDIIVGGFRLSGSGTVNVQIYANSTNTLTGATLLGTSLNFTSNLWSGKMTRSFAIGGGTLTTNQTPTALVSTDVTTPATATNYIYNPTTQNLYIIFAMLNGNTTNVSYTNFIRLLCY